MIRSAAKAVAPDTGRVVRVRVPASTANLGPGFDSLGMALGLHTWIDISAADETVFHLHGDQLRDLPTDKSNLVYRVAQTVFDRVGVRIPELEVSMYSEVPLARGLGSSAAAIVGALAAANALVGSPLPSDALFQMACALEGHPDNVGAALYGGFVIACSDGERAEHIRVEPTDNLDLLVAIPHYKLSTEKARQVLPKEVGMRDAAFNVGHSSLLVAALCTGRYDLIRHAMKDALHQPYRAALIPGMPEVLAGAVDHGALGVALSGAGPTLIALVDGRTGPQAELERFLLTTLQTAGVTATLLRLKPCPDGVSVLSAPGDHATFRATIGSMLE